MYILHFPWLEHEPIALGVHYKLVINEYDNEFNVISTNEPEMKEKKKQLIFVTGDVFTRKK